MTKLCESRGKYDVSYYTRVTAAERVFLRYTEIDYQLRRGLSALTSSGSLSMEWLRRPAISISFQIKGGTIHV